MHFSVGNITYRVCRTRDKNISNKSTLAIHTKIILMWNYL